MGNDPEQAKKYEEWLKKIKQASNSIIDEITDPVTRNQNNFINKDSLIFAIVFFFIAVIPRLYFIFFISDPQNAGVGWYNDSYHHWQIGYLTKEIGLGKGFLRLWDLKGMEFFWGLLHPLVLTTLFTLTGTADITVVRVFNSIVGSLVIVLLFLLIRRHFNLQAALGAAFLAVLNPVGIFTDTSGMVEPLGILMLLLGVYFWPVKPILTAFFWFLASLARAEHWVFVLGLIFSMVVFDKKAPNKPLLIITYIGLIFFYLKYLLDKTGNAIYPIYWNFLGNATGQWEANIPLTAEQESIRIVFLAILILSSIVAVYLLIKKPKLYQFSLLGVGNFIFLSIFVGFTQYLKSYLPRFWVDRIFLLPYLWLGFVIALILLYFLPKKIPKIGTVFGWLILIVVLGLIQLAWLPILYYSKGSNEILLSEAKTAGSIASYYKEGSILIPGEDPVFTYELYKHGIKGKNILGQTYDPYFYFTGSDPYEHWQEKNRKIILDWFKKENIRLLIFNEGAQVRYAKLVQKEKDKFQKLGAVENLVIYEIKL